MFDIIIDEATIKIEAEKYDDFRKKCKAFLTENNCNYDKFTVVSHDSFIGYITEKSIIKYLREKYSPCGLHFYGWEDIKETRQLQQIITSNDNSLASIDAVKEYFYDKFDIVIRYKQKEYYLDVKTALTKLEPKLSWNFLYPVVQAKKEGKDYVLLVYFITDNGRADGNIKKLTIVGYSSEKIIRSKQIQRAGTRTKFGTLSQIDNYITTLKDDYFDLDQLISYILSDVQNT